MDGAMRAAIEVTAGILPGQPDIEYTRRWVLPEAEWTDAQAKEQAGELLATLHGQAQGYAAFLMLQPDRLNWVRTEWVWI